MAVYGVVLLLAAVAYYDAGARAARAPRRGLGRWRAAIGSDFKGNLSLACYVLGVVLASLGYRWPAFAVYCFVALIWVIPDLRIERALAGSGDEHKG